MVISSIFIKVGLEIQEKVFSTRRVMYSIHKEYDSSRQQNLQLLDDPSVIYMESIKGQWKSWRGLCWNSSAQDNSPNIVSQDWSC